MRYIRFKKLEQFCLHVIVENLEKFIYNKNIPQKHIDFLLRVYSEDVFKKFSHREQVSEDCMLWFLNPHSRKIMLTTVSEKIVSQLQIVGSTVSTLSLRGSLATEPEISAILSCVPHLTHLDLSGSECSDRTLLCLQRLDLALVNLNLYRCQNVTCDGIVILCGDSTRISQSLRNLNLYNTGVLRNGIKHVLKRMNLLECLKYNQLPKVLYYIHKEDFKTNAYQSIRYCLTELIFENFWDINPVKVIYAWTVLCPNVKKVHMSTGVTEKLIHMCLRFQKIEDLKIVHERVIDFDLNTQFLYAKNVLESFASKASMVTKLDLFHVEVSIKILMECYKNLKSLSLREVTFTDCEEEVYLEENKLEVLVIQKLVLEVPGVYSAILFLLSVSKNLTTLSLLSIKNIPQDIFEVILNSMKNLTSVEFGHSTMYYPSFIKFFEMPAMTTVCLDNLNISPLKDTEFKRLVSETRTTTQAWYREDDCIGDSCDEATGQFSSYIFY